MWATSASAFNRCVSTPTSVDFALLPDIARVNPFGISRNSHKTAFRDCQLATGFACCIPFWVKREEERRREKGENWPLNKGAGGRAGCMRNDTLRLRLAVHHCHLGIRYATGRCNSSTMRAATRIAGAYRDAASWCDDDRMMRFR